MAAMVSVVRGGELVQTQQFGDLRGGRAMRMSAIAGARYILTDGGTVAAGVFAKRDGKNLFLEQRSEPAETTDPTTLIIEDFFGSDAQLVGVGAAGEYQPYLHAAVADTAQSASDSYSLLSLAAGEAVASADLFRFDEGVVPVTNGTLFGLAALAGGFALSNDKGHSSKSPSAPLAVVSLPQGDVPGNAVKETAAVDGGAIGVFVADALATGSELEPATSGETARAAVEPEPTINEGGRPIVQAAGVKEETTVASGQAEAFGADTIPVIDEVRDDQGAIQGNVENGGYTDDGRPLLVGKAAPGVLVHIYRSSELIGQVFADANGQWSFMPKLPLADGRHVISILHEYTDGDVSEFSDPYVIFVDKSVPDAPLITGMVDDQGRIAGTISNLMVTDDSRPTIDGTAEAYATIIVYDKGNEIGRTKVDADGNWRFTPEPALADGTHILSYSAVDLAGNGSERSAASEFVVDTRPEKVNIYLAEDNEGSIQGEMFNGSVTDDNTPTLIGTATAGGIVSIYEGDVLLGQVTADVDGTWQFTPPAALVDGRHTFDATVTLVAKGESERSKPFVLNVDATSIEKPSIDQVLDNVGDVQGAVENGKSTDDNTPTLVGKAAAGSNVHVYEGGTLLGSVLADESGNWRFPVTMPLVDGAYVFTVKAENKAGNFSEVSNAYEIEVDTTVPTQIASVSGIGKDSGFNAHDSVTNDGSAGRLMTGELSASLAANERLEVSTDGGKSWVTALVEGRQWSVQDGNSHAESWTVQTRVIDGAGNVGAVNSHAVVLDTVAPNAPTGLVTDGLKVTVAFDRTRVVAGDKLLLANGGQNFVYKLTEADITAGKVTSTPGIPLSESLTAAIVNQVGNKSADLSVKLTKVGEYFRDSKNIMEIGESLEYEYFTAKNNSASRIVDMLKMIPNNLSHGLWIYSGRGAGDGDLILNLKNPTKTVSFWQARNEGTNNATPSWVSYLDEDGVVMRKVKMIAGGGGKEMEFTAPEGKSIASIVFDIQPGGGAFWVSGFVFDSYERTYSTSEFVNQDVTGLHFGGKEDNVFSVAGAGQLSSADAGVHGGQGRDTLKLTGANKTLDLTALGGKISSIEIIDITGTGNNMLKLSLNDVLENGALNQFVANGRVQMMVKGNAGDSVNLSDLLANGGDQGDWVQKASVVIDGVAYVSYQHSSLSAELLVQQGVTVVLDNHAPVQVFSVGDSSGNLHTDDAVHAGVGDDVIRITRTDFALLDGGLGIDTLMLDGTAMHLDLTVMGSRVQGFEKFHLGAGGNQLSLGIDDVLAAGARDLFTANGKLQMVVNGADGEVNLLGTGNDWMMGRSTTVDGVNYAVYSATDLSADLFVEQGIQAWGMVLQVDVAQQPQSYGAHTMWMADSRLEAY